MTESAKEGKIVVSKDGPYLVSGDVPIMVQVITPNSNGDSWEWKDGQKFNVKSDYALCRCGQSKTKPFCDGSHARMGFDGRETASNAPYVRRAETIEGPTVDLSDAQNLCAFARFCDAGEKIWSLIERTDEPEARELAIHQATLCPSGRLVLHDKKTHKEIEPSLPPSIGVVEDPAMGCSGPLWVRGEITIESQDGTRYEKRNRVTLCRCGASENKPFCNGAHATIKFNDGLVEK
jgi:CDGSH-type Zn-finger protein